MEQFNNVAIPLFLFLFGTAIGSFLNVLIDRLPNERSIMGRSHCDYCKKKLASWDLIPIFSFLFLQGKCRYCKKTLSWQYPLVEFITGVLFVVTFNVERLTFFPLETRSLLTLLAYLGLVSSLIVIFFADAKYQIIPDSMQISFFVFSIMLNLFQHPLTGNGILKQVQDDIRGGIIVLLPIFFLFLITKGKGMGFGDVKLSFTIGFLLGITGGLLSVYIAFITGALWGLLLIILKMKKLKSKIAFGPFLVIGIISILFYEKEFLMLLRSFYGI